MYSVEDKERVRAATNLVELVAAVTKVKRTGRTHMAICPFHQEKTPSMSIDAARGLYYCHGCHASGDVFTFVQETQGLSFVEALELLASQAGITLTRDPTANRRHAWRRELIDAVRRAVDFYHRVLTKAPEAGPARAYLRSRGYDAATVTEFKLGYSPSGGNALVREMQAAGVDDKVLVAAGLARRGRGGSLYDEMQNRVLFPVFDLRGDPVGFGGRALGDEQPKYRNTPETSIYKKSGLLYGLDRARRHIPRVGYAVVVEGYTDVIALHKAGVEVAVATCGTALGEEHFDLLRRFTDRVVLAFDADSAGAGAALRGDSLQTPTRLEMDLRVADLPEGKDPADLVQEDRVDDLLEALERSRPLIRFRIDRELARFDLSEPEGKARALQAVKPRLEVIDDEIVRAEYVRYVAQVLDIDPATVNRNLAGRPRQSRRPTVPKDHSQDRRARIETELLRAVLAEPAEARRMGVEAAMFRDPELRAAFERVAGYVLEDDTEGPVPLRSSDDPTDRRLLELATDPRPVGSVDELVRRLQEYELEARIAELRGRLARLDPAEQASSPTLQELVRLQEAKRELERT
jgi:DNA primase